VFNDKHQHIGFSVLFFSLTYFFSVFLNHLTLFIESGVVEHCDPSKAKKKSAKNKTHDKIYGFD